MTFTSLLLPVPMESPEVRATFAPFIKRFCDTYRKYPAGAAHTVFAICNGGDPDDELKKTFRGMNVEFMRYDGQGCDFGSFQHVCKQIDPCFTFCCVSRVYFHRAGWLKRMVEARKRFGPGLYGTSASLEGSLKPHICTRAYGLDSEAFKYYPLEITSRDQGTMVEVGRDNPNGSLTDWCVGNKLQVKLVYWSGIYPLAMWNQPENIFRKGDQSAMLCWDKHSDAYKNADETDQKRLSDICFGI